MTTRTWKGGTAKFNSASAWTPAGTPVSGDTLSIVTGTADARGLTLSGLTINLGGSVAAGRTPALTLLLQGSVIASNTKVHMGQLLSYLNAHPLASATIEAEGSNVNKGTIGVTGYTIDVAPHDHPSATLTIDVGHSIAGIFTNVGTLRSEYINNTLVVHGQAGHGQLQNNGLIEAGLFVKLDIGVIGIGRMQFTAPIDRYGQPPVGAQIEATSAVGTGQTVEFKAASGKDSHATLVLDDPRDFHGLISHFIPFPPDGSFGLHPDRIAMPGVNATALHYQGTTSGGTLTVNAGWKVVAQLRFAGSYTTNSFQIVPLTGGGTGIELKSP